MATFKIKRGPAIAALAAVAAFFVVIMCCLRRGLERYTNETMERNSILFTICKL